MRAQGGTGAREAQACRGVYSPVTLGMPCRRGTGKATTMPRLVPTISKPWQTSRLVTDRRWCPGRREGSGVVSAAAQRWGQAVGAPPGNATGLQPERLLCRARPPGLSNHTLCSLPLQGRETPGARLLSWAPQQEEPPCLPGERGSSAPRTDVRTRPTAQLGHRSPPAPAAGNGMGKGAGKVHREQRGQTGLHGFGCLSGLVLQPWPQDPEASSGREGASGRRGTRRCHATATRPRRVLGTPGVPLLAPVRTGRLPVRGEGGI